MVELCKCVSGGQSGAIEKNTRLHALDPLDIDLRTREILDTYADTDANIGHLLCDRHPQDRTALTTVSEQHGTVTHTYGDLAGSSTRVANYLTERGIGRGDRVATVMGNVSCSPSSSTTPTTTCTTTGSFAASAAGLCPRYSTSTRTPTSVPNDT